MWSTRNPATRSSAASSKTSWWVSDEDLRVFLSDADQVVDVEEPAVVDGVGSSFASRPAGSADGTTEARADASRPVPSRHPSRRGPRRGPRRRRDRAEAADRRTRGRYPVPARCLTQADPAAVEGGGKAAVEHWQDDGVVGRLPCNVEDGRVTRPAAVVAARRRTTGSRLDAAMWFGTMSISSRMSCATQRDRAARRTPRVRRARDRSRWDRRRRTRGCCRCGHG